MGSILAKHAPAEIAAEVVPKICRGEQVVALGLTEPRGGSDAAHLQLKARREAALATPPQRLERHDQPGGAP